ncbi:MAG: CARDB domain-containing protein, partial [Candidatus Natronoplasma sp.]
TETEVLTFSEGTSQYTWSDIDEADEYTAIVTIGEIERSYDFSVISVTTPAEFEVSNLRVDTSTIEPGNEFKLTIDVTNIGDETGEYTVNFYLDSEHIGSETVTVDGGETVTVTHIHTINEPGEYDVSVEEERISITVRDEYSSINPWWFLLLILALVISILNHRRYNSKRRDT